MTREQEEAIEMLEYIKEHNTLMGFNISETGTIVNYRKKLAIILLNLIQEQQKKILKKDKRLKRQFNKLIKNQKIIDKQNKTIDLIIDKLKKGTEYYYSEFDNMSKEEIYKYFERKAKEC